MKLEERVASILGFTCRTGLQVIENETEANHFRLDFHLVESFSQLNSNNSSNHVSEMGFGQPQASQSNASLLASSAFWSKQGASSSTLCKIFSLLWVWTSFISEMFWWKVKKLIQINSTELELPKSFLFWARLCKKATGYGFRNYDDISYTHPASNQRTMIVHILLLADI